MTKTLRDFAQEIDALLAAGTTPEGTPEWFDTEGLEKLMVAFATDRKQLLDSRKEAK